MANVSGNAYALTVLSPIKEGLVAGKEIAYADAVRDRLYDWNELDNSPMAKVPQTYLCRYFVLDDVYVQSLPSGSYPDNRYDWSPYITDGKRRGSLPAEDRLQSRYLVFSSNFHAGPNADLDGYLHNMWDAISDDIREVWGYCYGFDRVSSAATFAAYIKKCQLETTLFFVGSNDDPLPEQLKALFLKQEFARFAATNQGLPAAELRKNYNEFITRVPPEDLNGPSWSPGQYKFD